MPGWTPFRSCLLLAAGETESWTGVYLTLDIDVVDAAVQAEVVNAQTGVTIFEVLASTPVTFAAGVPQTLATIGGAAWTPAAANKHATLRLRVSGGTPAVEALDVFIGCPVIDFPEVSSVIAPDTVDGVEGTGEGGGGDPPTAPTWGLAPTPGNGQITLHVVAAAPTDVIYARQSRFLATPSWSAESETFKRTGTGDIVITGLTNEQYSMFTVYAKAAGLTSAWLAPRYAAPTAGLAAQIDQIMAAVAAEVNAVGLTDSAGHSIAAEVEIPPLFDTVDTACVKVFPDVETGEASHNELNEIRYRVNVAFCERSKTTIQQTTEMLVRERLRDQFLGKRLVGMSALYCEKEPESGIVDVDALWERFQWVSVVTFEFVALRAHG